MQKWLLFSALAFAVPVRAQTPAIGQKIEYRRDVPKLVARLMPRGAKSLFWGWFTPKAGSAPIAIHLIALRPKTELDSDPDTLPEKYVYHFALDVFEIKQGRYHRVCRVPITYFASMWGPVKVRANFYWLDETTQKTPVFIFDCFTTEALLPGEYGDGVFVVFPQGWTQKATFQNWGYGNSNSGATGYALQRDRMGQMQVKTSYGDNVGNTYRDYIWNGQKFSLLPGSEKTEPYPSP